MAEPLRKRRLGRVGAELRAVDGVEENHGLVFVTHHSHRPGRFDLCTFISGDDRPAGSQWSGPFSGRPELARQLAPAIFQIYRDAPAPTVYRVIFTLRTYWRLFDKFEAIAPVNSVADLNDLHGAFQMREGIGRTYTGTFLKIANQARQTIGLPPLYWPVKEDGVRHAELPDHKAVAAIYQRLKHDVYAALARWRQEQSQFGHCFPTKLEVQKVFLLFLLRTGWNPQTALDLDVHSECVFPHPTSPDHHIVRSVKARGNTEQVAIGLEKSKLSPGNLVRIMIEHTRWLRDETLVKLKLADSEFSAAAPADQPELRRHIAELRRISITPWVYATQDAQPSALNQSYSMHKGKPLMQLLIREINATGNFPFLIPDSIRPTDLRDAYVGFAYQQSGYSWMVAKLAAGHKSIASVKHYLRQRQWKAFGEQKVAAFQSALWSEIQERRVIDPAVLFALVERGEITEQQRLRWLEHKDRTRVGVGCRDFRNPPRRLVPDHVSGTGCRVQRCMLCPLAVVFPDSIDHLARRLAELQHIHQSIPLQAWIESSFDEELINTESALQLFDGAKVEERLSYWRTAIAKGWHVPLQMEGEYAS